MPDEIKSYNGMPTIGVDCLYLAKVIKDDADGCTYEAPIHIAGLTKIGVSDNGSIETFYADNGAYTSFANKAAKEVAINLADLPLKVQAEVLGASYQNGLVTDASDDVAPEYAIGYRRLKSDGSHRYVWMLKGKLSIPSEDSETKGQSVNFQQQSAIYKAENRLFDNADRKRIDDNDPELGDGIDPLKIARDWFKDPNVAFLNGTV